MPGGRHPDLLRELAAECVALAERTVDPDYRVELLMIAQKWVAKANDREAVAPAVGCDKLGAKVGRVRKNDGLLDFLAWPTRSRSVTTCNFIPPQVEQSMWLVDRTS